MGNNELTVSEETARLLDENISELVLYYRKPEREIIDLIKSAMTDRNIEWNEFSKYSVIDFHRGTEANIFCLSKWNAEENYQSIIRYIKYICKQKSGKILDFGGGTGELTINLSASGLNVDFLEVPSKTLDFAKWRFKKRCLDINTFTSLNHLQPGYDILICLDVLEVLDKPLSHLKKFFQLMNPGGLLILSVGNVGDKSHPMNLEKNRDFFQKLDEHCTDIGFNDSLLENKFHLKIKTKP